MTYIHIEGEIHSSKNSRRVFHGKAVKSKAALQDENMLAEQLLVQVGEWRNGVDGEPFPLRVKFYFYRQTRRRWDFLNIAQGVADAMVRAGYIPDDDVEHLIPIFAGWEVCKDAPGVDFWISHD